MAWCWSHESLVRVAVSWLRTAHRCPVAVAEPRSLRIVEQPDAIGWRTGIVPSSDGLRASFSVLVECKTSKVDFLRDAKKPHRARDFSNKLGHGALGHARWFLAPAGVIPVELLPEGWGLAEVPLDEPARGGDGYRVRVRRVVNAEVPAVREVSVMMSELLLLLSVVQSQAKRLREDMNVIPFDVEEDKALEG